MRNLYVTAKATLLVLVLASTGSNASSVGLTWDANVEGDLAGYRIYYASFTLLDKSTAAARANPLVSIFEVSKTTTTDVYLKGGTTYYFRATAFDTARNESGFNVKLSSGVEMQDEVSAYIKQGDVNGDGQINTTDLTIIIDGILNP